jgi:hypothetical protein
LIRNGGTLQPSLKRWGGVALHCSLIFDEAATDTVSSCRRCAGRPLTCPINNASILSMTPPGTQKLTGIHGVQPARLRADTKAFATKPAPVMDDMGEPVAQGLVIKYDHSVSIN